MNTQQKGFSAVEVLVVVIIVGLIGFGGWYVWSKNSGNTNQATTTTSAPSPQADAYTRTTTVPASWKTYTNDTYKFSVAYPANWKVEPSTGALAESASATNKNTFDLGFRPYTTGEMVVQDDLQVSHETIAQAVADYKRIVIGNEAGSDGGSFKITKEDHFTYDGHEALRVDTTADDDTQPNSYFSQIYIEANGLLYKFETSFEHEKNALKDKDLLTVFESLKIQ